MMNTAILPPLIDEQTLFQHIDSPNIIIIDLSSTEDYAKEHIPNAINVPPQQICSGEKPAPGKLPSTGKLQALLRSIGLTNKHHVICYDNAGGSWGGRMVWTLDCIQHKNSSLLDGGIQAWRAAGLPLNQDIPKPSMSNISIDITNETMIDKQTILKQLGQNDFCVWDTRSHEEYQGTKILSARGGHIPGAVHLEWTLLSDPNNHNKLRPINDLQTLLNERGLSANKTIATHCQTHRRSGLSYFVAKKLLNYPHIKAYPGSWSEWGNDQNTPIET